MLREETVHLQVWKSLRTPLETMLCRYRAKNQELLTIKICSDCCLGTRAAKMWLSGLSPGQGAPTRHGDVTTVTVGSEGWGVISRDRVGSDFFPRTQRSCITSAHMNPPKIVTNMSSNNQQTIIYLLPYFMVHKLVIVNSSMNITIINCSNSIKISVIYYLFKCYFIFVHLE